MVLIVFSQNAKTRPKAFFYVSATVIVYYAPNTAKTHTTDA